MTITEARRFELHQGLQRVLGGEMASTLMEHLPPSGWSDVARRHDIDMLNVRFDALESRIGGVDRRIDSLDGRLKLMLTGGLTFGLAILALQVQIVLSLARL